MHFVPPSFKRFFFNYTQNNGAGALRWERVLASLRHSTGSAPPVLQGPAVAAGGELVCRERPCFCSGLTWR